MGGSDGGGSTTSTQVNYSPEEALRRTQVMDEAARIYGLTSGSLTSSAYPGSVPVGPSANTTYGQNLLLGTIPQVQQSADQANQASGRILDPNFLYAESNPYLSSYINAAVRPIQQQLTDAGGTLSGIRDSSMAAGQYGGTRQGIAEGIAVSRANQQIGDVSAQLASQGYGQALDAQKSALALAPQTAQLYGLPAQYASAVGAQQEQYGQNQADYEALARQWALNAPWLPLQNYANLVYGGSSPGTTSQSNYQTPQTSPLLTGAGGAAAGYSLAASTGAVNPYVGAAIGLITALGLSS